MSVIKRVRRLQILIVEAIMMKVLLGCNLIMLFIPSLVAQGQNPPEALKLPAPAGRVSAEQLSKANNRLADMNALNFQNYYLPSLYGVPDAVTDGLFLRPVVVAGGRSSARPC